MLLFSEDNKSILFNSREEIGIIDLIFNIV